jgi:hypothetical protein
MPIRHSSTTVAARKGSGQGALLSRRALNRALLERQFLLRRSNLPAVDMIQRLVGMQAQTPNAPYLGLWTRLDGFRHEDLTTLINNRCVMRIALMRGTIHLVTASDCLGLRPMVQPAVERGLKGNFGRRLADLRLETIAAAGRKLLERRPHTFSEIGLLLRKRWPDRDAEALANAVRALLPLVQVPPRGIWGAGGLAAHVTAEAWLGQPLAQETSLDEMVLRYLGAFGPATVRDMQAWSGLTRLGEVAERLRPLLCTFRNEQGLELFDLPDASRPDPDVPAPPRFLPVFDNVLLAHADRSRIVSEDDRSQLFGSSGLLLGTVLLDGFVGGKWKISRCEDSATLTVESSAPLRKPDRTALAEEGTRLLAFAVDAHTHTVEFVVT